MLEKLIVVKRNGEREAYLEDRVFQAILSAFVDSGRVLKGFDNAEALEKVSDLASEVTDTILVREFEEITVDEIQEIVFDVLLESDEKQVAKNYIKYAEHKNAVRKSMPQNREEKPEVRVVKKSGRIEPFLPEKIVKAVSSASPGLSEGKLSQIVRTVTASVLDDGKDLISTDELHEKVENTLKNLSPESYDNYAIYRRYKKRMSKSYDVARQESEKILLSGDKENANRDSQLNSTKQTLTAEAFMKQLVRDFELSPEVRRAHEEGWLYIHDLGARYLRQANCCLFDMGNLLKGGFSLNGMEYAEPKYFSSAMSVMGDVVLSASGQQFGGFTVPEIDDILAPYAEKSYRSHLDTLKDMDLDLDEETLEEQAKKLTLREIEQGVQGFETKLNTISSSLGQVPFVTVSFGLNTSFWGREVTRAFLNTRIKGMGKTRITAVFPKLVMLMRKDVNRDKNSPNRDLYDLAVECSKTRLYPDYLSLDQTPTGGNNLATIYERSGEAVTGMGCRAYLSPYWDGDKEVYTGRGNLGAVSLNLPKMAIEANGDLDEFFRLIDATVEIVWDYLLSYREKVGKQRASTNPLFYAEGGAWKQLSPDDEIFSTIEAFTNSLGYVGVNEAVTALTGESILKNHDLAVQIVSHLADLVKQATKRYGVLFAIYSTPAESLCYTFQRMNRAQYGVIEGVTDREYMTNSFHVPVWEEVSVPEKIAFEQPFHEIATGGRISYCEFPYGTDTDILTEAIDFAMDNGMYYGVNVVSSSCNRCSNVGDFFDTCPKCGSDDIVSVTRVCGYLSFSKSGSNDDGRYNPGKQAEILDRVKHGQKHKIPAIAENAEIGENLGN